MHLLRQLAPRLELGEQRIVLGFILSVVRGDHKSPQVCASVLTGSTTVDSDGVI